MDKRLLTILILADDHNNSADFKSIINDSLAGAQIFIASESLQALRLAEKHKPDVILVDVSMDKRESLKISQIIKKEKDLQLTPMLFITDLEEDREFRKEALKAGAEAFLIKPIEDTILITQLKAMAKIKERNMLYKKKEEQLEDMVEERTRDLKQEIRERKILEKELRKSENLFKTYIGKAPIGILVINALGQYIDANEKACEMMGYTKEELLYQSAVDYLSIDGSEKGFEAFQELIDQGTIFGEYKVARKNHEVFWIELYGIKINDNCLLSFYIDISERKLSENQLKRASQNHEILSNKLVKKIESFLGAWSKLSRQYPRLEK